VITNTKFQPQKRQKLRIQGFDYSRNNKFFITTNIGFKLLFDRKTFLGEVVDGKMILNNYGAIVHEQWMWLKKKYPYIELHEFIIMPDHFHGILEINRNLLSHEQSKLKIKPLTQLIGAFKTTSSKKIHLAGKSNFEWHRSYYARLILDQKSFENTTAYIKNNPANWRK
jgi:putative transposase